MANSNFHLAYRPDIDGLRAIAILAVVLFHAFPTLIPGGFVGVDIFFVISGFLISSIIFKSVKNGNFNFSDFYVKRIKRILPALVLVMIVCYAFGWLVLLPEEFKQLGKHIAAGAGFSQNIILWQETGYFDNSSELKPLMHLWSLAIEEQYYLVYPLIIFSLWRCGLNIFIVIALLAIISFALNVNITVKESSTAFFMPYTRIWELLAGSLLAYVKLFNFNLVTESSLSKSLMRSKGYEVIAATGLLLIVISIFGINKNDHFPGWLALAPVAGAFLLIFAGANSWINNYVLANRFMVFIGLISYPLYLWHWPLLSFLQILKSDHSSQWQRISAVILSFFLAWLTYCLIEKPIRFKSRAGLTAFLLCTLLCLVGLLGYYTFKSEGISNRYITRVNSIVTTGKIEGDLGSVWSAGCGLSEEDSKKFGDCMSDRRGEAKYILVGDSKSSAMAAGIFLTATKDNYWRFIGGNGPNGAPIMVISDNPLYSRYQALSRIAMNSIIQDKSIRVVVLTVATRALFQLKTDYTIEDLPDNPNFDIAFSGLSLGIAELVAAGKKVVLTVDNPTFKDPKQCISRKTAIRMLDQFFSLGEAPFCFISYDNQLELSKNYRKLLEKIQLQNPSKVRIFDPLNLLCDMNNRTCTPFLEGRLLYGYSDHISTFASVRVARELVPFVESFSSE